MYRTMMSLLVLSGTALWLLAPAEARAQSAMKKGGPTVDLDGMKSQVFEVWKPKKVEKPVLYSFMLPKELTSDKDAGELTIQEVTGKPEDLIAEWKKSFIPPKGTSLDDVARISDKEKVGNANVTSLLIMGTYLQKQNPTDSDDKAKKLEDYRMKVFLIEIKDKKYMARAVGPFKTVGLHLPSLDAWVKAFK